MWGVSNYAYSKWILDPIAPQPNGSNNEQKMELQSQEATQHMKHGDRETQNHKILNRIVG